MMKADERSYLIYLSPEALSRLHSIAAEHSYAHPHSTTKRGISALLNATALLNTARDFTDTRPPHYRDETIETLEAGIPPTWQLYPEAFPVRLQLSNHTIRTFLDVALRFAIVRKAFTPVAMAGAVIEAIGSNFITPTQWPRAVTSKKQISARDSYYKYGKQRGELNW
jgi:hypothetical protein